MSTPRRPRSSTVARTKAAPYPPTSAQSHGTHTRRNPPRFHHTMAKRAIAMVTDDSDCVFVENAEISTPDSLIAALQQSQDNIKILEGRQLSAITCPLCLEPNFHPRMLGCGHTFCESCLMMHHNAQKRRSTAPTCPTCRCAIPRSQKPPICYALKHQAEAWAQANAIPIPSSDFVWPPPWKASPAPPAPMIRTPAIVHRAFPTFMPRAKYTYGRYGRKRDSVPQ
ncbi:hypothetical protein K523DRAFT_319684 [Schizophyllum commune Tattone D]|nr:hypothetical protein K523DRAFT_319684 [Schizophyllum commune Tattone D]